MATSGKLPTRGFGAGSSNIVLRGFGSADVIGSGDIPGPVPVVSGSGDVSIGGTGDISGPTPSTDGVGSELFTAIGDIVGPVPEVSGNGDVTVPGIVTTHGLEVVRTKDADVVVTTHGIETVRTKQVSVVVTTHGLEVIRHREKPEVSFEDGIVSRPLTWIETTFRDDVVRVFAEVDLPDRFEYYYGYKAPKVLSFSDVVRGLSDRTGQLEHTKAGALYSDTDRFWRGALADIEKRYLLSNPLCERMIDDEDRRLEKTPRIIFVGFVSGYAPKSNFQFVVEGSDWLKLKFNRKARASLAWQPRISLANFPHAIAGVVDITIPIIYGAHSDQNDQTQTVPGDPTVPLSDGALRDITGLTFSIVGPPGTQTNRYAVAASNGNRAQTQAVFIDVPNAPADADLGPTNYVQLDWDDNPGAHHYVVYGRYNTSVAFMAEVHPSGTTYYDGTDAAGGSKVDTPNVVIHPPTYNETVVNGDPNIPESEISTDLGGGRNPVIYVGERDDLTPVGDGDPEVWYEFLQSCHAVASFDSWYLDGGRGGIRQRDLSASAAGPWCMPFHTGFDVLTGLSDPFVDINGQRYTVFYGRKGTVADLVVNGTLKMTTNLHGVDRVGDSSDDHLGHITDFAKNFAVNFLASDGPRLNWLTASPMFEHLPTVPLVDVDSFDTVKFACGARTPDGDLGSGIIGANGEEVTALDALARLAVSGDFDLVFSRKGSLTASLEPITRTSGVSAITDVISIKKDSFEIQENIDTDFFNILPYVYARDYVGVTSSDDGGVSGWFKQGTARDERSIDLYRQARQSTQFELHFCNNVTDGQDAWSRDVMVRKLGRWRDPKRTVSLTIPYTGLNYEPGDVRPLTHIEGIGLAGWVGHDVRFIRHTVQPTSGYVKLEAYDMENIFNQNALWAPEDCPDWDDATPEQRRAYLFWSDEDGQYSDGAEGKGWS